MIQHLQNSLPVLILSTPYSVLEYSMLSTAVFHTKYWSHSASTLDTPKGIGIEWKHQRPGDQIHLHGSQGEMA